VVVYVASGYQIAPWPSPIATKQWSQQNNMIIPFNRKGIFCTGLTPQSTFTLNFNSILEVFPTYQNPQLVLLTKPSPSEDYVALELYSKAVRDFPVGVMFGANGLGDWILGCVDPIADFASEIGTPVMGAINGYQTARKGQTNRIQGPPMNTWASGGQVKIPRKPLPATPKKRPIPPPKPASMRAPRKPRLGKPLPPTPTKKQN